MTRLNQKSVSDGKEHLHATRPAVVTYVTVMFLMGLKITDAAKRSRAIQSAAQVLSEVGGSLKDIAPNLRAKLLPTLEGQ